MRSIEGKRRGWTATAGIGGKTMLAMLAASLLAAPAVQAANEQCTSIAKLADATPLAEPQQSRVKALRRTVVVTKEDGGFDPAVGVDFSFARTLGQIIRTAKPGDSESADAKAADTTAERIALTQSMIRSFAQPEFKNATGGVTVAVDKRPEANLDAQELLGLKAPAAGALASDLRPVGFFNRFDLSDAEFENCGEHRIVYELGDGPPAPPAGGGGGPTPLTFHRLTLIFEASVPNPAPALKENGCTPIKTFWKGMEAITDAKLRAQKLEEFYFKGLDLDGDGKGDLPPVVHFSHYGTKGGQVRGNLFVVTQAGAAANPWQLREWLVGRNVDGSPTFNAETVKDNPIAEFFGAKAALSPALAELASNFQSDFLSNNLRKLLEPEHLFALDRSKFLINNAVAPHRVTAAIAAAFDDKFNDFQSISGSPAGESPDDPTAAIANDAEFKRRINAWLAGFYKGLKLNDAAGAELTDSHITNRAGTVTCGGCHQFSNNEIIAPAPLGATAELKWPPSLGFVHINERGELSPALNTHFLLARCEILHVDEQPATAFTTERRMSRREALPPGQGPQSLDVKSETVARVESAQQTFFDAGTPQERSAALGQLEGAVRSDRARREQTPGAFYRVRRPH